MKRLFYIILPIIFFFVLYSSYAFLKERLHNEGRFIGNLRNGHISYLNVRFCFCSPDQDIFIQRGDGLKTVASIYFPEQGDKRSVLVIINGN